MNATARIAERTQSPARLSVDEFMAIVGAGVFGHSDRVELVDGAIFKMSPQQSRHMHYMRMIQYGLYEALRGQDNFVVQPELSLQLAHDTVRVADIGALAPFDTASRFPDVSSVSVVIEISDTTLQSDLSDKRFDYAAAAIPNYWVVDVEGRRVHLMSTPLDGDYAERRLVSFSEPLAVPGTSGSITID